MFPVKPTKTPADYLVVSLSPVLIMLLVGSLSFFLIEVFFRGPAAGSVRWVMFWFVMAVVLVSRIGIEQGKEQASIYGLALAAATWLYLVRVHPAYILGMILLGVVWWCSHKLTWDCTLIDEDDDASGQGLLQTAGDKRFMPRITAGKNRGASTPREPSHPPGLWVVYFSLAALPLFGIGQVLLPRDDIAARHAGFVFLFVYVAAALGLLITTSFLGLRRYLRQRYLSMPGMIAFGWIRFGAGVALVVLVGALLLPRPGANEAWQTLRYQIDHQLRQASQYAARFSPPGKGQGRAGGEAGNKSTSRDTAEGSQPRDNSVPSSSTGPSERMQNQASASPQSDGQVRFYPLFKILFWLILTVLVGVWLIGHRHLILQIARSWIAGLSQFFKNLFQSGAPRAEATATGIGQRTHPRFFASYRNPFLLGKGSSWTPEQVVVYSFEALQAWAQEHGLTPRAEQTAREFSIELGGKFPEITSELSQLSLLYGYAAYGKSVPAGCDLEPVKKLWRFLSA